MSHLQTVPTHKESLRGIAFSPSDTMFATYSDDKTVIVWNYNEVSCESTLLGHVQTSRASAVIRQWTSSSWEAGGPARLTQIAIVPGEHDRNIWALDWHALGHVLLHRVKRLRLMLLVASAPSKPMTECNSGLHATFVNSNQTAVQDLAHKLQAALTGCISVTSVVW